MKKVLIVLCISAFFVACNGDTSKSTDVTTDSTTITTDTTSNMAPAAVDTSVVKDSTHVTVDTSSKK